MTNITLRQWAKNFKQGIYNSPDIDTQIKAGWYDWFCKETSLHRKTQSLGKKVLQICKSSKIDIDKHYVFFKNNCPMSGSLYDDFRICDLETGNVVYTIVPRSGFNCDQDGKKSKIYGKENGFDTALVTGSWKDVRAFFGV
jgi:hypothetical protein